MFDLIALTILVLIIIGMAWHYERQLTKAELEICELTDMLVENKIIPFDQHTDQVLHIVGSRDRTLPGKARRNARKSEQRFTQAQIDQFN